MIVVRPAETIGEVTSAIALFDRIFGPHAGYRSNRDERRDAYERDPGSMVLAFDADRLIGAAGFDGKDTINHVAIDVEYRNQGVARRLLKSVEDALRDRGANSVGLGSVDDAVDFYLKCGYVPQLLVQFGPDAEDPATLAKTLLSGLLADREVFQTEWRGHPQLWLQEQGVDWELKRRIEDVAPGIVAQYIMQKQL